MNKYTKHTKEEHTQALANLLPNGKIFTSKNIEGTKIRKLLQGLSEEFKRSESLLVDIIEEYDSLLTDNYDEKGIQDIYTFMEQVDNQTTKSVWWIKFI